MSTDTPFTPKLGRPNARNSAAGRRYLSQVKSSLARRAKRARKPRFGGAQIGRGAAAGRAAAFRAYPFAKFRMRRVVVKTYIARARQGIGKAAYKAHIRYIQRDGVERDGTGGTLYDRNAEDLSDRDFLARSEEDRHQFRVMVSAEEADRLEDLRSTTRAFMAQMEKDLHTRLDWVAVDHHNTGHPHTHIVIRGKDDKGKDLVIAPDYVGQGMRRLAREIVTRELGPRRDMEIAQSRASEATRDRLTTLDRKLAAQARDGIVSIAPASTARDRFERTLVLRRLQHLERLHLATPSGPQSWRLAEGWQKTLTAMGKSGDIVRTLAATPEHAAGEGRQAAIKRLAARHGVYRESPDGVPFDGVYKHPVTFSEGRFALVTRAKEFTLVPWRPELEQHRGRPVTLMRRGAGIEWTVGRAKGLGR